MLCQQRVRHWTSASKNYQPQRTWCSPNLDELLCPFNVSLGDFLAVPYMISREGKTVCAQPCPTLWDPKDCSPLNSSVRGIFQSRILEGVAVFYSRLFFWLRDQTHVPHIDRQILYHCSTWECPTVHQIHPLLLIEDYNVWSLAYKKWRTERFSCLGCHRTLLGFSTLYKNAS